jgi:maleamate amidohydrolase
MTDDLNADYLSAGFGNRLGWGNKPAVLVVDMCRAYVDPASPLCAGVGADDAYAAAKTLVTAARAGGHPILWTRVEYQPGGADGGQFFRKVSALACFERGNPLGDFTEHLRPEPGDVVITKQYASAFFGTSLAATLVSQCIDTVVICGVSTSGCVRATAVDALQHGFVPVVVADACGDRDPLPHHANLFDLAAKYADVVTLAEATQHLAKEPEKLLP